MGYSRAGFEVVGVDIKPQKHYPFEFHQADAMTYPLDGFDVIHASPPCQGYANVTLWRGSQDRHPRLIESIRQRLTASGKRWIIENVRTMALSNPHMLCGSEFGLRVIRHRYFESPALNPRLALSCNHSQAMIFEHKQEREFANRMGCEWMSNREGRQAIPPAYTEFIGKQLMEYLN